MSTATRNGTRFSLTERKKVSSDLNCCPQCEHTERWSEIVTDFHRPWESECLNGMNSFDFQLANNAGKISIEAHTEDEARNILREMFESYRRGREANECSTSASDSIHEPAQPQLGEHAVHCPHCKGRLVGKMPELSNQRLWGVITIRGHFKFDPSPKEPWPKSFLRASGLLYRSARMLADELNALPHRKQVTYQVVRTSKSKTHSHGVAALDRSDSKNCRIDLKYLTFDEARNHAKRFNLERTRGGATSLWSFVLAPEPIGLASSEGGAA